jgi:hypothetical protein
LARPIVLILHLFRLASVIDFRKDYSTPSSSPPSRPYTNALQWLVGLPPLLIVGWPAMGGLLELWVAYTHEERLVYSSPLMRMHVSIIWRAVE